eukprot:scaffold80720_cov71-Phaeocystis_antarctica.AAC.4
MTRPRPRRWQAPRAPRRAPRVGAQLGSRIPRSQVATAQHHRLAAAPAGCAAPPRPASRAPPPSAVHPHLHPCRAPRPLRSAPPHYQLARWSKARAPQEPAPRPGAAPSAALAARHSVPTPQRPE